MIEDLGEVDGELLDLVVGERQAGQLRRVLHLGARDPCFTVGHARGDYLYVSSGLRGFDHQSSGAGDQSGSG